MHIDGCIDGVIDSAYNVSIGVSGEFAGLIKAHSIVVSGVLEGTVSCDQIEILSTGRVIGELVSGTLSIEAGGQFVGERCEMTEGGMILSLSELKKERYQAVLEHGESSNVSPDRETTGKPRNVADLNGES